MKRESRKLNDLAQDLRVLRGRHDDEHYPEITATLDDLIGEADRLATIADHYERWIETGLQTDPSRPWRLLVTEHGAVGAARRALRPSGSVAGLDRLWEEGRLDASAEASVLRPEFVDLFTEAERAEARGRLARRTPRAASDR